jgi:hypothetical protein
MHVCRIDHTPESYEPSPLEIWRQCVGIQATWTRDEERKRREATDQPWCAAGFNGDFRLEASHPFERQSEFPERRDCLARRLQAGAS